MSADKGARAQEGSDYLGGWYWRERARTQRPQEDTDDPGQAPEGWALLTRGCVRATTRHWGSGRKSSRNEKRLGAGAGAGAGPCAVGEGPLWEGGGRIGHFL